AGRQDLAFAPAAAQWTAAAAPPGAAAPPSETAAPGYPRGPPHDPPRAPRAETAAPGYPGGPRSDHPGAPGVRQPVSHRRSAGGREVTDIHAAEQSDARLARLSYADGIWIGATQIS